MRRNLQRIGMEELIKENIKDLENDRKLLQQIEEKIDGKHSKELFEELKAEKALLRR